MFRKYTVLAAALILASTMTVSLAENAVQPPLCDENWVFTTTCGDACATFGFEFTTQGQPCATYGSCDSTCSPICSESFICEPTAIPQPMPTAQPTQKPSATQKPSPTQVPSVTQKPSVTQAPSTGDDYTTQSLSAQEQKMVNLLNQDRKSNGLAALTVDPELCRIARIKSADMRDNGYFAHESPTYGRVGEMLRRFGYAYAAAGENIAHHANVDKAQAAFMSSSGHRANILSATWQKVGVGIVTDRNGFIYATQIFVK